MAILYLVLLGSIAAFACFLYAIQHLSTEQVSIYAYINPVVAVLVGSLFFQEQLSPVLLTGGAVTLYGVYIVNKAYRKK
jgi:drug/metabolite transporter (DMT)-like permease